MGKNHTTELDGSLDGSSIRMPPCPLMYCFSTATSSLPLAVATVVPSMSLPVL